MIKNRIESFAKYAGIATVSVEWLALLLYYLQRPEYFGGKYPISYFATLPQTRFIFSICYTLAGIFFWIFIRHHLHRYYRAPITLFTLSMVLFLALAIVPYDPANHLSSTIHSTLGYSSSIFFAVGMYLMAKNAHNKTVHRVTMLALLSSLLLLFAFTQAPKNSNLVFAFEAGSWLVWQLWIIWISFYSYKNSSIKK